MESKFLIALHALPQKEKSRYVNVARLFAAARNLSGHEVEAVDLRDFQHSVTSYPWIVTHVVDVNSFVELINEAQKVSKQMPARTPTVLPMITGNQALILGALAAITTVVVAIVFFAFFLPQLTPVEPIHLPGYPSDINLADCGQSNDARVETYCRGGSKITKFPASYAVNKPYICIRKISWIGGVINYRYSLDNGQTGTDGDPIFTDDTGTKLRARAPLGFTKNAGGTSFVRIPQNQTGYIPDCNMSENGLQVVVEGTPPQ